MIRWIRTQAGRRRRTALWAAAVLALAGSTGCGAGGDAGRASTGEAAANGPEPVELLVSAAASMTDSLNEIKRGYEASVPGVRLTFNFGASGALQQQIEQGAQADLFVSASERNMNALVDKGLVAEADREPIVRNELVVVVPASDKLAWSAVADLSRAEVKTVAVGIPESVPAGAYAKEALTRAGLWDALQPKTVQAKDVRQVLTFVETGNADAGFVYKTDALSSERTKVAFAVDPAAYTPAVYPAGVVKATKHPDESRAFLTYLRSKAAADVFARYGFSPVGAVPGS
ncbi:molybdate ABC transporter substrate-binding protein [Paenibacillus flagellatus]|uniref:molybdate ABC transporter substrate-binding protein n=1 Tax=Paenibacillus flagellatus TaxID=2211139 RepID=UPI001FEC64A3|nr:molybdate ABC transporter substrate-binding protein [Paenibacillus flagellatus]